MTEFRFLAPVKGNGKLDAWRVDWHFIKPDPDNDLRDLTTPENRAHIEEIKNSIEKEGVKDPLLTRTDSDDNILAVDGRVRLVALAELEAEGREVPKTVLTLPEPRGTSREERIVNMIALSTLRKNYDPFEIARGVKRLLDFGWSEKDVADRMHWKSVATVKNYLDQLAMPSDVKKLVTEGKVSATVARSAIKEHGEEFAKKLIAENLEENRKIKGKKERATPKGIKKAAAKAGKLPVPAPRQPAEPQPEPHNETVVVDAPSGELSPVQEDRHAANGGAEERVDNHVDEAAAPGPLSTSGTLPANKTLAHEASMPSNFGRTLNGFFEAVEPFAKAIDTFDFDQIQDDQVVTVEMMGVDLKRFSAAWLQAQGDRS